MNWFLDAGIFERFRGILHEGEIDKRVQFMIEGLFAICKTQFQVDFIAVLKSHFRVMNLFQLLCHNFSMLPYNEFLRFQGTASEVGFCEL
jgi:hypothetical protein